MQWQKSHHHSQPTQIQWTYHAEQILQNTATTGCHKYVIPSSLVAGSLHLNLTFAALPTTTTATAAIGPLEINDVEAPSGCLWGQPMLYMEVWEHSLRGLPGGTFGVGGHFGSMWAGYFISINWAAADLLLLTLNLIMSYSNLWWSANIVH